MLQRTGCLSDSIIDWSQACGQATCLQESVSASTAGHHKRHLPMLQMGNEVFEDIHWPYGLEYQLSPAVAWLGEEARAEIRRVVHQVNTMHRQAL